jgi:hypothetical protein
MHVIVPLGRAGGKKLSSAGSTGKQLIARKNPTSGLLLYFTKEYNLFYHETSYTKQGMKYVLYNNSSVWFKFNS